MEQFYTLSCNLSQQRSDYLHLIKSIKQPFLIPFRVSRFSLRIRKLFFGSSNADDFRPQGEDGKIVQFKRLGGLARSYLRVA